MNKPIARPVAVSKALAAALTYAARGWKVHPTVPGSKAVRTRWRLGSADPARLPAPLRSMSEDEWWKTWGDLPSSGEPAVIRSWWTGRPDSGVGVQTGRCSDLVIIDIDQDEGVDGDATLARLEQEHGALPVTVEQRTPRGGRQLLFRYPAAWRGIVTRAGLGGRAPKERTGVDVRGDGGQALLAPTKRGPGAYAWTPERAPDELGLAELPEGWREILEPAPPAPYRPPGPHEAPRAGSGTHPWCAAMLEGICAELATMPRGQRNPRLFWASRRLHEYERWIEPGAIVPALLDAARANGLIEDDGEHQAMATIRSGERKGRASPKDPPERERRAARPEAPPPPRDEELVVETVDGDDEHETAAGEAEAPPPIDGDPGPAAPERAEYVIRAGEGHLARDFAIARLAEDERVYVRGAQGLVTLRQWTAEDAVGSRHIRRAVGSRLIATLSAARLWAFMQEVVAWKKLQSTRDGVEVVDTNPSTPLVNAVHADGEWRGVRRLIGIATVPILRMDGTVYATPGYDPESGMFYAPDGEIPAVPEAPSRDDALRAAGELLEIVCDFPIPSPLHRAGFVAALLTPLVRHLCDTVPMFVFDANTSSAGKTMLASTIGIVVTGSPMPASSWVADDDELRKRILAHALSGDQLVLIDNVPTGGAIGWPSLDRALTLPMVSERVLRTSSTVQCPNTMTWYATGNNVAVVSDTARRALVVRLDSKNPHPEERPAESFVHEDLLGWVTAERPRLLGAAMTLLSAYLRAGAPAPKAKAWATFGAWMRIVRGALCWLELGDVSQLFATRISDGDSEVSAHIQLLEAWLSPAYANGLTSSEALCHASEGRDSYGNPTPPPDPELRDAIMELCPGRGLPTSKRLGEALRRFKGKVRSLTDGRAACLDQPNRTKSKRTAPRWVATVVRDDGTLDWGDRGDLGGPFGNEATCARPKTLEEQCARATRAGGLNRQGYPQVPPVPPDSDEDRYERLEREAMEDDR